MKDLTEIAPEVGLLAGRSTLGSDGSVTEGSGWGYFFDIILAARKRTAY